MAKRAYVRGCNRVENIASAAALANWQRPKCTREVQRLKAVVLAAQELRRLFEAACRAVSAGATRLSHKALALGSGDIVASRHFTVGPTQGVQSHVVVLVKRVRGELAVEILKTGNVLRKTIRAIVDGLAKALQRELALAG